MNDEYQTQHYWNNMKKSELKELIKEQIKSLISESEGLHNFFYGDDENAPKPQGLNKFRPKGMELLNAFPFTALPMTRKDVNWDKRGVDKWGGVYLPNITGDLDAMVQIFDQDQVKEFIEEFIKKYKEEPIFSINPSQKELNKVKITNPKFIKQKEDYVKDKISYLDKYK